MAESTTCTAANTSTSTSTAAPSTAASTTTAPVMSQPDGNQAALDAAGLTRDPAAEDPSLADAMIANMLGSLPLELALMYATEHPDDPACLAFLSATPISTVMAEGGDAVSDQLDGLLPDGRGYTLDIKVEGAEGLELGAGTATTLKRTGDVAAIDLAASVSFGATAGVNGEGKLGGGLVAAVGEVTAQAKAGAAQSVNAGWNLPLDASGIPDLIGQTAADLMHLDLESLCAHVEALLTALVVTAVPDRLSVGFAGEAGISQELSAGGELDGATAEVGESVSAGVTAATSAGYDERGVYGQSAIGGNVAMGGTLAPGEMIESLLGMRIDELQVALGGTFTLRVNGSMGNPEDATAAPEGVSYDLTLTHDGGVTHGGAEADGGSMKTQERYTFASLSELVAWVTSRKAAAEADSALAGDWTAAGGVPAESLPDVGFQRSFTFTPGDTEGLDNVLPGWLKTVSAGVEKLGLIESVTSTKITGQVTVPIDAVKTLVGDGGLPVNDGDVEAAVVDVERRLADGALAAEAAGQTAMVVDGRDVSAAASSIKVAQMALVAELAMTADVDLQEEVGTKAGIEAKGSVKVEQSVPLGDRSQAELLKQLAA